MPFQLRTGAKVDNADRKYFQKSIKPLLDDPPVEWIGEVSENGKQNLLANAYALFFPIDWLEPFGLVLIEAMACGTPAIAYRYGSVPELVEEGVTGFIVDDLNAAVAEPWHTGIGVDPVWGLGQHHVQIRRGLLQPAIELFVGR
jgi:glycosyltransferase involved in cell wall biosynthesis